LDGLKAHLRDAPERLGGPKRGDQELAMGGE
jgi:hypothetical protein